MSTTNLTLIDSGLSKDIKKISNLSATTYCIQATVGGFDYKVSGPGGTVTAGTCP